MLVVVFWGLLFYKVWFVCVYMIMLMLIWIFSGFDVFCYVVLFMCEDFVFCYGICCIFLFWMVFDLICLVLVVVVVVVVDVVECEMGWC